MKAAGKAAGKRKLLLGKLLERRPDSEEELELVREELISGGYKDDGRLSLGRSDRLWELLW